MVAGIAKYTNQPQAHLRKVRYTGDAAVVKGQGFCYERDYVGTAEGETAAEACGLRDKRVELLNEDNVGDFAGVATQAYLAKTGGQVIEIAEPGSICMGYTDQSCTINVTLLSLNTAGTFTAVGSGSGVIARALQTVDRSSTPGTVLVELIGGPAKMTEIFDANSGRGASRGLWKDCPWNLIAAQQHLGHTFFDDFIDSKIPITGTSTTEIKEWIQTEVTSGLTQQLADFVGGALRVSSEANASADDGLTVMYRSTPFVTTSLSELWFEARVRMTDIDTTPDQFFIGLIDTITSAHPSGVIDDTKDKIGFFSHSGTTVATLSFITAKTTVEEITTGAATSLEDAGWVKLGFKVTWPAGVQTVTPYVNGVAGTAHVDPTKVPTPGTGLGICLAAHVDQTSAPATLDVDWIRIAQKFA